jgi:O-antigen/teichoic acid export membrane protein
VGTVTAAPPARPGFARTVAGAAATNVVATATAAVAGLLLARALGPTARGEYAAVVAWFGTVLALGQLGQTAATTYYVARDPYRAADYLATARFVMLCSGGVALTAGILATPLLAGGRAELAWGYRLMFATCLVSFLGAAYVFALQAVHVMHWNLTRVAQPLAFLAAVVALARLGRLSLLTALGALAATIVAQALLARTLAGRNDLTGGRRHRALGGQLRRYGLAQLAASVPTLVAARLDQLLLSLFAPPAALGHYAVAVSLTSVAVPLVSAAGSVAFPRLAGDGPRAGGRLPRQAVVASLAVGLAVMVPLAGLAPWLVPAVLGGAYRDAVPLVLLLAPAGVLLPCAQVCGDLLRGYGRPLDVARAQMLGAVVTLVLLAALMPPFGAAGAALASSVAALVTVVILLRRLRRAAAPPAAAPPATGPAIAAALRPPGDTTRTTQRQG